MQVLRGAVLWYYLHRYGDYIGVSLFCVLHFIIKLFSKIEKCSNGYSCACLLVWRVSTSLGHILGVELLGHCRVHISKMAPSDFPKWLHHCKYPPSSVWHAQQITPSPALHIRLPFCCSQEYRTVPHCRLKDVISLHLTDHKWPGESLLVFLHLLFIQSFLM